MWCKILCCITLFSLIAAEDSIIAENNNSIHTLANTTKLSNTTTTTLKDKKTEVKNVEIHNNPEADVGSIDNPMDPVKLAKVPDDQIGNEKYYFAILLVSSLSVITVIIFKMLR
jgi:hypothetical protein